MNTCRPSGGKDRHLKVNTSKGPRDRRIRLSVSAAIQLYDIQDRLDYNQPSKAVEWLIKNAQHAISELKPLPFLAAEKEIATESEKHLSIAESSRDRASLDDQFSRSKPFLDVYSSEGGLLFSKESYDSRFIESTLRTFHHVSDPRRLDVDDQTVRTRDEETARAKSLEWRCSDSMPGCSMSEAIEEKDVECLTVKMDPRFQARERAKERAKVKSLFRTTDQKHITNDRFMPSETALQTILIDNKASRMTLNSSPSGQSSQSSQYSMFSAQAIPDHPLSNSIQFLEQNTAGSISREFLHRFDPPSQTQHVSEMLLQSSVDPTRLQLRPTVNDNILLGSMQPASSSTSRTNPSETPFSLSYVSAPAVYQYLSNSGHPLFHAVAMSQLSALGFSNYSQQEVFYHSQAYRPPEFPPLSTIHSNAPTNNLHGNSAHSSWQGWPQTFGHVLSTDGSSTHTTSTLLSQELRRNEPADTAVQAFSDLARSLSPPPTASLSRQDFTERDKLHVMFSDRGTFRSLIKGSTETIEGVFKSEEHSQSSV